MMPLLMHPSKVHARRWRNVRPTPVAALLALIGSATIWTVATMLGADFEVAPSPSSAMHIGIATVTAVTVVAVLLGGLALGVSAPRWPQAATVLARLGLAIGAVSMIMPLTVHAEPGTKIALMSMHLLTGIVWWLALHHQERSEPR